jgi:hypothetical protein
VYFGGMKLQGKINGACGAVVVGVFQSSEVFFEMFKAVRNFKYVAQKLHDQLSSLF